MKKRSDGGTLRSAAFLTVGVLVVGGAILAPRMVKTGASASIPSISHPKLQGGGYQDPATIIAVCSDIVGMNDYGAGSMAGAISVDPSYPNRIDFDTAYQLKANGGISMRRPITREGECLATFTFSGIVDGTSYNLFRTCPVSKLFVNDLGQYLIEEVDIDGCR